MKASTTNWRSVGRRLRGLRVKRGLSQAALAGDRCSAAYISLLESGRRRPQPEVLEYLCDRLGITPEQLLTGRDPDDDLRLEIEIQQAIAQIHAGEPGKARKRLQAALSRALEATHLRAAGRAQEGLALALYKQGKLDEALAAYEQLETVDPGRADFRTEARVGRARCLFQKGHVRDAIHVLESRLFELEGSQAPDPSALVQIYSALIPMYFEAGLRDRAKDVASRGAALADTVADVEHLACLHVNRAGLLLNEGAREDALRALGQAEDLYRQLGWHSEVVKITVARALVFVDRGELDHAQRLLESALAQEEGSISPTDRARAVSTLAQIRRMQDRAEEGLRLAREAISLLQSGVPVEAAEANREAGLCAHALGDDSAATGYWRRALALFKEAEQWEEVARLARLLGDHLASEGDVREAAAVYRDALTAVERVH